MRAGQQLPVLRMWLLVTAILVALASGDRGQDHGGKNGHGGPHDHEDKNGSGSPQDNGDKNGGPPGWMGHHDGEGQGPHGGQQAPECTDAQTAAGMQAAQAYAQCTGLEYGDFMSLVHVDLEILQAAEVCFDAKLNEMNAEIKADKQLTDDEVKALEAKIDKAFSDCVDEAEAADETNAAGATIDFLNKILGPESKICSCFPAFEDKMPQCRSWARFHHFGMSVEKLCEYVDGSVALIPSGELPNPSEAQQPGSQVNIPPGEVIEDKADKPLEPPHEPHVPNSYGPCAPGQPGQEHPDGPNGCQPSLAEEEGYSAEGGPPRGGQGGGLAGFGMMVLGVIVVGASVGVGGVWAWGKFQGGTRQPGVRYMATGLSDNDIGTELGPFGREYA